MTVNFDYTITNASHYDAVPLMSAFNKIREALNRGIDESNIDPLDDYTFAVARVTDGLNAPSFTPTGGLEVHLRENGKFIMRDHQGYEVITVDETGTVTIG